MRISHLLAGPLALAISLSLHGCGDKSPAPAPSRTTSTTTIGEATSTVIPPKKHSKMLGAYFANWAQYHSKPYGPYSPSELGVVLPKLDVLFYMFAKFDNVTFELQDVETRDKLFQHEINAKRKQENPNMKFVLSIGGWSFPSAYFSQMVSSAENRSAFIKSTQRFLEDRGFDGVDIDWEYPCSEPRTTYIEKSCTDFEPHYDAGGKCPEDADNFVLLVQELRAVLGSGVWISVASQAAAKRSSQWHLKSMATFIDYFNIMTYDYSVSDTSDARTTAPNAPLYNPRSLSGDTGKCSVSQSVQDYLIAGVPARQIFVGVALYGHTWYTPGESSWQKFGVPAQVQGKCCGPDQKTYGAEYGPGSKQCGTLMVSEIEDSNVTIYHDQMTNSAIGMTPNGVWISFDDKSTILGKAELVKEKELAGVFAFDTSMDIGAMSGDYVLLSAIRNSLDGVPSTTQTTTSTTTATTTSVEHQQMLGAYFANWAQYHSKPYGPYSPAELGALMPKLDVLFYMFAQFDNVTFTLQDVETRDKLFQHEIITKRKEVNPGMKFVLSVGGWSFPSAYFSQMVSSKENRSAFVKSTQRFLKDRGFDGVDIDWEYPCSEPRTTYIEKTCTDFEPHYDAGGKCPEDADNFVLLVQELRAVLGSEAWISVASQAAAKRSSQWHLQKMADSINYFNIMTYDYSVSDTLDASKTAPNAPLYNPSSISGDTGKCSVAQSVQDYLAAGVPAKQIFIGIAMYGHTWYTPGETSWQQFGVSAKVQGECCGPDRKTYGAKGGPGSKQCGTMMVSEIEDSNATVYHDKETNSAIAMTPDGVWISFDDKTTLIGKAEFAKRQNLAGVFAFDTSMDIGSMSGEYVLMSAIRKALDTHMVLII